MTSPLDDKLTPDADKTLQKSVEELLKNQSGLDDSRIIVECDQGVITLKGKADTEDEKKLAEKIAGAYPNVKAVKNELQVEVGIAYALTSIVSEFSKTIEEKPPESEENKRN